MVAFAAMRLAWLCLACVLVACKKPGPTPTPTGDENCYSPEKSMEYAKPHRSAEAPYADCAAGIFSHCPPNDAYCSIALDAPRTKQVRADGKKLCCYGK